MMDRDEFIPFIRNHKIIKAARSSRLTGNSLFFVRYNSQLDLYDSSLTDYSRRGWEKLTYYTECIDWNHEDAHRMSYLKRHGGCPTGIDGVVHWRFDLSAIRDWTRIEIFVGAKLWRKTSIDLKLILKSCNYCGHKKDEELSINKLFTLSLENRDKKDLQFIDLIATLKGPGHPDDGALNLRPQLFRTHDDDSEWLFSFTVF